MYYELLNISIVNNFVYIHTIIQFIVTLTKAENVAGNMFVNKFKMSSMSQRLIFTIYK